MHLKCYHKVWNRQLQIKSHEFNQYSTFKLFELFACFTIQTIRILNLIFVSALVSIVYYHFLHTPSFTAHCNIRRAPHTVMGLPHKLNTVILELSDNPVASSSAPCNSIIPHWYTLSFLILLLLTAPAMTVMPSSQMLLLRIPIQSSCSILFTCSSSPIHLAPVVISRQQKLLHVLMRD